MPFRRIALVVLMAVPPAAHAACPDFAAAVNYGAGTNPLSVATADFNRDGISDLVTANSSSNNVSILLGNANGTFGLASPVSAATSPSSVAVGDFDGDGRVDLAIANFSSDNVTIRLGNGIGGFNIGDTVNTGDGPSYVVVGDFNLNGVLDLAVANANSNNVSILLGNGFGGFGLPTNFPVGTHPQSIAAEDFDRDGDLDLVVANHDSDNVSYLAGNGSGSFGLAVSFPVSSPSAVTAGDFNADGKLDLAAAAETSGTVVVLIGNGAGSFGAGTSFVVGSQPHDVVARDFSGDGKVDLAVSNYNSNTVSILAGNGAGGFAAALNYATANGPTALAVADFDGDRKPDVATANLNGNNISILLNIGACFANCGTFGSTSNIGENFGGSSLAAGDWDRDGILDLFVANGSTNKVSIFIGGSGGTFGVPTGPPVTNPVWIATADFNRDGNLDFATANESTSNVTVILGDGNGLAFGTDSFAVGTNPSGPQSLVVGDFNRDGAPDLAVSCGTSRELVIMLNTTSPGALSASFTSSTIPSVGSDLGPRGIATGDFNLDGRLDLAIADFGDGIAAGSVLVYQGNGNGAFTSLGNFPTQVRPKAVGIGDFNRDGRLDLAVPNFGSNNVTVLMGNAVSFGTPTTVNAGTNPFAIAVSDVNTDGNADLAVVNNGGNNVSILLGNGTGAFAAASPATYPTGLGSSPTSVAAADFDRDGKPDLAVATGGSNNLAIVLNSCPPPDLTVSKSHSSVFTQGGTSAYTITVNNIASVPTGGLFQVVDTLPTGLTATEITGPNGWTCTLADVTCRRSDPLAGGTSSSVQVVVSVAPNAPSSVNNLATVSGGSEVNTANNTATDLTNIQQMPDMTITKSHVGNFSQGQTGATYTIHVSNVGGAASGGSVQVVDSVPIGMTATSITGTNWNCILGTRTCTRNDSLAAGNSYDDITLTVNVAPNAPATLNNGATVSGGGQTYTANDIATDPTNINQVPDLTITKTHVDNFTQGQVGATYTITVTNSGGSSTSGEVSVTDTLPSGLTATAISGTGWNCILGSRTCTRSNPLAAGNSYPAITLTVNVAGNASSPQTNTVVVSGGGETFTSNDSASDPTIINQLADLTIVKTHSGNFTQGQMFRTYTLTVSNIGQGSTTGTVTVVDTLPAGLTLNSIGGFGWSCTPANARCTRSDSLAAGNSYDVITLNVNVSDNAPAQVTNTATVSGGGEVITDNDVATSPTTVNPAVVNCDKFRAPINFLSMLYNLPRGIAIGDFDNDGSGDVVVANGVSNIVVSYGFGNGSFGLPTSYPAGANPSTPALGDYNGDGLLDIAVPNSGSNTISILLGNDGGGFSAAVNYTVGNNPTTVAAGDFNGDGKLDLAAANNSSDNVSILIGSGTGTFATAVNYATNAFPTAVGIGDFNGDGKSDLAVATQFQTASILLGNGDGTFATWTDFPVHDDPRSIVVADFNRDGKLDLAVAHLNSADVSILLGNGNGTFAPKTDFPSGAGTLWLATGDLDHDGNLDLAVANFAGVSILKGIGNGSFGAAVGYSMGGVTSPGVALADMNGDGKLDLLSANGNSQSFAIRLSDCADLSITKTHSGNFTQGQTGATYTITVSNSLSVETAGTVTVSDNLPTGLTATAISGTGWTCALGTLACTRGDVLAAGASYPPITLTVTVNSNAGANLTNVAMVSSAGDPDVVNSTASDPTTVNASGLIAPTRLVATALPFDVSQVSVSWDPVTTALSYQVYRSFNNGAFLLVASPSGNTFGDTGRTAGTTYLYRVHAVNGANVSGPSNVDLATTIAFTDDPLVASIKAIHFTQLRTAIDSVRAAAGLGTATYTNAISAGALIKAVDMTEMRSSLEAARSLIVGLPAQSYVDPSLAAGTTVKAAHILDLRTGTK